MIKAIFFDLDETLVNNHLDSSLSEVAAELARIEPSRNKSDITRSLECIARQNLEVGKYNRDSWWQQYWQEQHGETLRDEQVRRLSKIFWEHFPGEIARKTHNLLTELSEDFVLVLITNDDREEGRKKNRIANLRIEKYFKLALAGEDGILWNHSSWLARLISLLKHALQLVLSIFGKQCRESFPNKPNRAMFEYALKELRLRPEQAVMVGDRVNADLVPAKELGMKTILVGNKDKMEGKEKFVDDVIDSLERDKFIRALCRISDPNEPASRDSGRKGIDE